MWLLPILILLATTFGLTGIVTGQVPSTQDEPPGEEAAVPSVHPSPDDVSPDDVSPDDGSPGDDATGSVDAALAGSDTAGEQEAAAAAEASADTSLSAEDETADVVVQTEGAGLFAESLSGGASDGAGDGASLAGVFDLDGYVRGDVFISKYAGKTQGEVQAGYGELSLQVRGPREPYGSAFADLRVRSGQQLARDRLVLDLREAYADVYAGPFDVRFGKQIIVWGRADAFNPTNNLMPFDMRIRSPIEDDRRVGNVAARVHVNLQPVRLEAVWVPTYVAAEYPPVDLGEYGQLVPSGARTLVEFSDPTFPGTGLDSSTLGARVHLLLPEVEASVSYVRGYAPLPGLDLTFFDISNRVGIDVSRTAYKQHVLGADFSTAVSDLFALRGEVAYRRPDNQEALYTPQADLQYVLGLDRAFGPVTVLVQYMGRYVFDWAERGTDYDLDQLFMISGEIARGEAEIEVREGIAGVNQILFTQLARVQHLATARVEWLTLHDTLSLSALGMANFTTGEWLLFPKLGYSLSDHLMTYFGAELYVGPEDTLFGRIDRLSAAYAEVRYTF